jgi:hypothetical protein
MSSSELIQNTLTGEEEEEERLSMSYQILG